MQLLHVTDLQLDMVLKVFTHPAKSVCGCCACCCCRFRCCYLVAPYRAAARSLSSERQAGCHIMCYTRGRGTKQGRVIRHIGRCTAAAMQHVGSAGTNMQWMPEGGMQHSRATGSSGRHRTCQKLRQMQKQQEQLGQKFAVWVCGSCCFCSSSRQQQPRLQLEQLTACSLRSSVLCMGLHVQVQ
jgi:hypothetical protein